MQDKINQLNAEGKKHGYWEIMVGNITGMGYYVNGLKSGPWKFYNLFNRLVREIQYNNGKFSGVFKIYNNGRLVETIFYANY
jgi:antitoxin component YwqK of YwqJK toxin-antitoxin module